MEKNMETVTLGLYKVWVLGSGGTEKKLKTTRMGYIGTIMRIHFLFLANQRLVDFMNYLEGELLFT